MHKQSSYVISWRGSFCHANFMEKLEVATAGFLQALFPLSQVPSRCPVLAEVFGMVFA